MDKDIPPNIIAIRIEEYYKIRQLVAEWLAWKEKSPDIVSHLPKEVEFWLGGIQNRREN